MKLIIKEYLSQLKESKELDKLLPDLLFSMGHKLISTPQIGVRQHGVDLASEYVDENNVEVLGLFVIKRGDIGRNEWDSTSQSVRQSLDEIIDVYLEKLINKAQRKKAIKIILCTTGILKQEIEKNWNGYIEKNKRKNKITYELWDGYRLASFIEENMLNENILIGNFKSKLRKTLALISDSDYDLSDYYAFLSDNVSNKTIKNLNKLIFSIRLVLNIIYRWSEESNNLKPSVYAAERTLLSIWELYKNKSLLKNKKYMEIYGKIYMDFCSVYTKYCVKIMDLCSTKNGLNGYSNYYILENNMLYEQLGIIAITGINYYYLGIMYNDNVFLENAKNIKNIIINYIKNHKSISSPVYDNHIIEITLAIMLLNKYNEKEFVEQWVYEIIDRITFAFVKIKKYYPVSSDSLEDAVLLYYSDTQVDKNMMQTSTLLAILLQFSAVLKLDNLYNTILNRINRYFKETDLQIWFQDKSTDDFMYINNAGYTSGFSYMIKPIPKNIDEMLKIIKKYNEKYKAENDISALKEGLYILPLVASRHFRTPILPMYWCNNIISMEGKIHPRSKNKSLKN